jgi:hypothetical protein
MGDIKDGEIDEIKGKDNQQDFDYNLVDVDTASFLKNKETKITQIRMMSVLAMGRELQEVHERLSNNYKGTFGKWCITIGISRDTAENYIRAYKYVAENFGNIESIDNIQPSLLFAISKPSAPTELQQKVIDGDITTHKEYQSLLTQLKATEAEKETEAQKAQAANKKSEQAQKEIKSAQERINALSSELTEERKKVSSLEEVLMTPMEVETAVIEKIPEEIERELEELREKVSGKEDYKELTDITSKILSIHNTQLKNWAVVSGTENSITWMQSKRNELITISTIIETMIDYLDEQMQEKKGRL